MGCIYLYTNKINGKQYVGQTTRPLKKRHWQHISQNDCYFDRAMKKYGANNFDLTVLEDDIFDENVLNERESYYIDKFDTFNNGYNMNRGGDNQTRFNEDDRDEIAYLIQNTNMSFKEIGEKTGYSTWTVSDINNGNTLPKENENYPLRIKRSSEHFSLDDIEAVIELLKTTKFSFDKIAELTNTNFSFVADINRGKRSFLTYTNYAFPIRRNNKHCDMTKNLAESIIAMLKRDDLSAEQIGEMFNVPSCTVGQINRGKHSICKVIDCDFPIRKKQYRSKQNYSARKIDDNQLLEIIDMLLQTSLSTEEIARRYNVNRTDIDRINRGVIFKPITNQYKLPIRQNRQYNLQNMVA